MFTNWHQFICMLVVGASITILEISAEHDVPHVTQNFYDPHYHDDGRNHLRISKAISGPTAASSASTMSILHPYAANSESGPSTPPIMAIVDHYYGPNGEEKVQYSSPSSMDKDELEQVLGNLRSAKSQFRLTSSPYHSVSHSPPHSHTKFHVPQQPPPPVKYNSVSSYKPSTSLPASSSGYSLSSLYKSAETYSKPSSAPTYRPAFSTIYKDQSNQQPKGKKYRSKEHVYTASKDSLYSPSYHKHKEPILLHSPKEPAYVEDSSFYNDAPKSISDSILFDSGYKKGYPPKSLMSNAENYKPPTSYYSPSHPTSYVPPPPHHRHHACGGGSSVEYSPYMTSGKLYSPGIVIKEENSYGEGSLKAGFHSLPMKHSSHGQTAEYSYTSPHHESYSSGFGGGYSIEATSDPYSRPSIKSYPSTSRPSSNHIGHSLSSLYEPLTYDDVYSHTPKSSSYGASLANLYAPGGGISHSKPSYGPPSAYTMSYGAPVEYHMASPPPTGHVSSSGPYSSPSLPTSSKYKGPYRLVSTGPSGYGYGKSHSAGNLFSNYLSDMFSWYKTRGGGWARRPPMMQMKPYYKYKYSTISNSNIHKHPFELENGPSEKHYRRRNRFSHNDQQSLRAVSSEHTKHSDDGITIDKDVYEDEVQPKPKIPPQSHSYHPYSHHSDDDEQDQIPKPSPIHRRPHEPKHNSYKKSKMHYHSKNNQHEAPQTRHIRPSPRPNIQTESSEVLDIHVFEKGFFDGQKKPRDNEWVPVTRHPYGEGGHGSASMERDTHERGHRIKGGRVMRHSRRPPPSRRKTSRSNSRPYHNSRPDDDFESKHHRQNSNEEDLYYDGHSDN
ncbi:hypothetical protein Ocin01_11040 [Orchesella cincta]|uniref:Uncharacterized protein n=1 Tax=Orchesella cincta TaxID=48709 RepID=A0A1D2MS54_ORCCI|nr:hypothetical protein Ocin01_11040 [Orchesella cincta]